MAAIQDAIDELREEIAEREQQIKLLNDLEELIAKNGLTEELYHRLCLTPLRNSDMLGETLGKVFSFLNYKDRQPNAFRYETLDGLNVEIPSSAIKQVRFIIPSLHTTSSLKNFEQRQVIETTALIKKIEKAEAFLNERNIFKQLRIAYPSGWLCIAALRYVFGNAVGKYKRQWETATKELERVKKRQEREKREFLEELETQRHHIHLYAPLFLQWTTRVEVCTSNSAASSLMPHITVTKDADGNIIYEEK